MKKLLTLGLMGSLAGMASAQSNEQIPDPSQGLGPFLAACFIGGALSLLTPCVFPMIPVTISYFSKRSDGKPAVPAGAYALGMIATFAVIGVLAAVFFGATGIANFAANPWVNLALGLLFVVLALNLFGLYEIQLPSALTTKASSATKVQGLAGPFLMGAAFSVTSFTCTMPIAAALLASAAKGERLYPVIGMSVYGLAFALPFFFLALFPSAMAKMPRSGDWLGVVKPALGFIELAAAVKFFSNADLGWSLGLLTRPVFLVLWIVIFGLLGLYLLGVPKGASKVGWARRGFAAASVVTALFLSTGVSGKSLGEVNAFLPPDPYPAKKAATQVADDQKGEVHAVDYQDALAKAKQLNRPIFIDFTGVNCTNCRFMEKNIFPTKEVQGEFSRYVTVALYTDRPNDEDLANQKLQTQLAGNNALPTYVLLDSNGKVLNKFEGATRDVQKYVEFLKKGKP